MFFAVSIACFSQAPQLKFLHLNNEQGLPDGTVKSVTRDKYGYIWLGTQFGLCRYNGYSIISFFHNKNDSNSLGGNFIWNTFTDKTGDLWVVNDRYLSKYRYNSNDFINYACPFNAAVTKVKEDENGMLWLASSAGLMQFDKVSGSFSHYRNHTDTAVKKICSVRINDFTIDTAKGLIYLATHAGFKIFDYRHQQILKLDTRGAGDPYGIHTAIISAVTKDRKGYIWFGCGFQNSVLVRWHPVTNSLKYYHDFTDKKKGWAENRTLALFTDRDGHIWAGGFMSGLSLYLPEKDKFFHYQHDALLTSSIAGASITNIYQDASGMIWTGTEGYGADRFNPGHIVFTSFQPQAAVQPSLLHSWGRAAIEDSKGNLWFGTSKGISVYDTATALYKNYLNDQEHPSLISFNTIRSFAEDRKGKIWIGTGNWLNRFDPSTGKFRIYTDADSLRSYFVWCLLVTKAGELYAGGTGGLQLYNQRTDKFQDVTGDSLFNIKLHTNVRNIFEDSRQGLWIGFYDGGILYYHPASQQKKFYLHDDKNLNTLCNNFVTSVAEDKKGIIWISTRDGLSSLNTQTQTFTNYGTKDNLPSNKTSALQVDEANRLWIGTGKGLSVLDPHRKHFLTFDMSDGLPGNEFNDQVASTTRDGRLIYPTYQGFLMFDPAVVHEKKITHPDVYISAFKVLNKVFPLNKNFEEVNDIHLRYDQSFFSTELTGLNYENPGKVFYAYRLEPFDAEWIYTQDRNINYTNLPGGYYKFLYKASNDPSNWEVQVHAIAIHVDTVFYKTNWFIVLVIGILSALIYSVYSYRLKQTRSVHHLQLQASRLEKDKTEIQYQNLINQFNPHFLFNSLTSLNSLIYENRELASEFLEQLSAVYRYLLTHKESQLVTLKEENEFVKHYVSLLKTRFENGLQITIDLPDYLLQKKIVPVTFQLLIENALKHNIADVGERLEIFITADEQYLQVRNKIQKKAFVETSNRKGLESLRTLYKYLSALPFIAGQENEQFVVRVPLI